MKTQVPKSTGQDSTPYKTSKPHSRLSHTECIGNQSTRKRMHISYSSSVHQKQPVQPSIRYSPLIGTLDGPIHNSCFERNCSSRRRFLVVMIRIVRAFSSSVISGQLAIRFVVPSLLITSGPSLSVKGTEDPEPTSTPLELGGNPSSSELASSVDAATNDRNESRKKIPIDILRFILTAVNAEDELNKRMQEMDVSRLRRNRFHLAIMTPRCGQSNRWHVV